MDFEIADNGEEDLRKIPNNLPLEKTAYLYWTAIDEKEREKHLVGNLTESLLNELRKQEYQFVIRDCRGSLDDPKSYAGRVNTNNIGSGTQIIQRFTHKGFDGYGNEVRFIMQL